MQTISSLKEQAVTDTPLIVFDCALANGDTEHWCTHAITVNGTAYAARVLQQSSFDIQTASDQGVDGSPTISVTLANADSYFSEIQQATGWKGAQLTVSFLFYDLRNAVPLTATAVVFQGICNSPDQIKEATFRLTATNRMNLQRLVLPEVRIQSTCPWQFPSTPGQQAEAVSGGTEGQYSAYYPCGYSAGLPGGTGTLNNGAPFTSCGYVRTDCQARGMFTLGRFGGLEFVPPVISVRGYGGAWASSNLSVNQARYNDFVPMVYGTAWYDPLVVFARNDGNLTRMEVLLGVGLMQGVVTVLVNDVQIPIGVSGANMTGTGWYNVVTLGARNGAFDMNFTTASGQPAGDPYGSMAYLSIVVPNQLNDGNSIPEIQVLAQGLIVPTYAADGTNLGSQFSNNPAWMLLDVLQRSGWTAAELDFTSFSAAAAYCDEQINSTDLNGNPITLARFQCNLVLQKRHSAGDVVRGIRNAARLFLTYGPGGVLQLQVENTIALQQPAQLAWSNSTEPLNGGWPSYEFGDGSNGFSGIMRRQNGEPSVTVTCRPISDTPNSYNVEYQDSLNGYQQDSFSVSDPDDIELTGQEVTASLMAVGLPNYDQAGRILQFNLDKSVLGNTYIQFETSVMAVGIRPGDIITFTYLKEGYTRQPFRVLKISPATNYRTTTIIAQFHDDAWYADTNGQTNSPNGPGANGSTGIGIPNPLLGTTIDSHGNIEFGVQETDTAASDGTIEVAVSVSFTVPATIAATGPGIPLVSFSPQITTGGTLTSGQNLYYAVSGVNSAGGEGLLSFIVTASIVADGSSVTLSGLSFTSDTTTFNAYRGATPSELFRIATGQAIAAQFTDTGLTDQLIAPPDPNFDHANFYWRMEDQPETAVTIFSATTVGNSTLQMAANSYLGMTARITRGTGAGQEASISSNTVTSITLTSAWVVIPDATSFFVIAEAAWHFGGVATSSPIQFAVPNLSGEVVQLTGRAANANDVECPPQLAIVTAWQIGGAGTTDSAAPPAPAFGLGTGPSGGTVVLSGVSFTDLTNTQTVSAGTLSLFYWNELQGTPSNLLSTAMAAGDTTLTVAVGGTVQAGSTIQIDAEVMQVTAVSTTGTQYTVTRGQYGSTAAAHAIQAPVYQLLDLTVIAPFPPDFFGSVYSGNWSFPILLPDVRIASALMFVTNDKGNGPIAGICLTHNVDNGLRTLAGGQYSIQVDGFLAVDQSAAPALVTDTAHSVRDVFAILGTSADQPVQLQINVNGVSYCQLTIPSGLFISQNSIDGATLPPLASGAQITLSVLTVGQTLPGADLTVVIRL
jgi:Putative phage tail protein